MQALKNPTAICVYVWLTFGQDTESVYARSTYSGEGTLEPEIESVRQALSAALEMASSRTASPPSQIRYRQDGVTLMAEHHTITMGESWIDETIMRMKKAAYSNKEIANKLREKSNGAVDYDPKTIGTRAARINKLFATEAEQRIDDELSDWHEGEDEALLEAEATAHVEMCKQIAKIKSKRWEYVARNLDLALKKDVAYSAGSCKKRFTALQNDTATIPIELADNPEQRLIDRQQRSAKKLQRLLDAEAAEKNAQNKKKLEKDERELNSKKRNAERAEKALEKSRIMAENAARKQAKAQAMYEQKEKRRMEENQRIAELQNNITTGTSNRPDQLTPSQKRKFDPEASTKQSHQKQSMMHPRSRMTVAQLSALCGARKLRKAGSKIQLQERLEKEANSVSRIELRKRLGSYGASTDGSKTELVERLAQADEANSQWTTANRNHSSSGVRKRRRISLSSESLAEQSADNEDLDSPVPDSLHATPVSAEKSKFAGTPAVSQDSGLSFARESSSVNHPSFRSSQLGQQFKDGVHIRTGIPPSPSTTADGGTTLKE